VVITTNYLLLKRRLKSNKPMMIIQNQGLVSSSFIGSYPIFPKALSRMSSSQLYIFKKKVFKFSGAKKFFINSIINEFYRLSVYL